MPAVDPARVSVHITGADPHLARILLQACETAGMPAAVKTVSGGYLIPLAVAAHAGLLPAPVAGPAPEPAPRRRGRPRRTPIPELEVEP